MCWVSLNIIQALWRADVIGQSTDWSSVSSHIIVLPLPEERHNEVAYELSSQNLGEEVNVRHEGTLQDDWDVGSIEQLNWVWLSETSHLSAA